MFRRNSISFKRIPSNMAFYILFTIVGICSVLSSGKETNFEVNKVNVEGNQHLSYFGGVGLSSETKYRVFKASDCDCGENSVSCDLQEGIKICVCKPGYAPAEYQICGPMCNDTRKCSNGGYCFSNVCTCKPGTSGPFCDTIDGCSDLKCENDKSATCIYDVNNFQALCKCKNNDQQFDYDDNICRDCSCDEKCDEDMCFRKSIKCEIIRGEKTCTCAQNYKYNPKKGICDYCYCGDTSSSYDLCEFTKDGKTKCSCKYGYQQKSSGCEKCDCRYGDCKFVNNIKVCSCNSGYSEWDGSCKECICGANAKCEYNARSRKTCTCYPGYKQEGEKCVEENTCYCGETATCRFVSGQKVCECPTGLQDANGVCVDVNECEDPSICHSVSMRCINTIGSYKCVCKEGYETEPTNNTYCTDINECLGNWYCSSQDAECLNTEGSFKCICKSGYVSRGGDNTSIQCQDKSNWKLGYGLLMGIFIAIIFVLMFIIYKKYRS